MKGLKGRDDLEDYFFKYFTIFFYILICTIYKLNSGSMSKVLN